MGNIVTLKQIILSLLTLELGLIPFDTVKTFSNYTQIMVF